MSAVTKKKWHRLASSIILNSFCLQNQAVASKLPTEMVFDTHELLNQGKP